MQLGYRVTTLENMLLLLCTLSWSAETPKISGSAQMSSPARSLAEAEYKSRSLELTPYGEGFRVQDGRGRTLDPEVFAKRSEDWWTWQRIDYQARLSRTVVSGFYLIGGLSALVGANVVPLVANGFSDQDLARITRISGAGLVVAGLGMVGGGYYIHNQNEARLADPTVWWSPEQAQDLVDAYNEELADDLQVKPTVGQSRVELQPALGPGAVGLAGRF